MTHNWQSGYPPKTGWYFATHPKLRELSDEEYSNIWYKIIMTTEDESFPKAYGKACIAAAQEGK